MVWKIVWEVNGEDKWVNYDFKELFVDNLFMKKII